MQVKTKMLQMSRKGQMGVGNLSVFAIQLLVVGIVVVVALSIRGSFKATLNHNGEATTAVNTSISNVNSALKITITFPGPLPVVAVIIIAVAVSSFAFVRRREEGRD